MINKPVMTLNGEKYQLATTLRVAFKIQGMHEHKPYAKVFQEIGDMGVEDQIGVIYASFIVANPDEKFKWTTQTFQDYCLDNINVKELMELLQQIIKGIMGLDDDEDTGTEEDAEKN